MFGNPASKCWRLHEVTQPLTACLPFQLHRTLVSSFSNLKDPGSSEGAPEEAAASGCCTGFMVASGIKYLADPGSVRLVLLRC